MHPAVTRFAAAVGRRVLIWLVFIVIVTLIRHYFLHH